jgi:hypothetical protein
MLAWRAIGLCGFEFVRAGVQLPGAVARLCSGRCAIWGWKIGSGESATSSAISSATRAQFKPIPVRASRVCRRAFFAPRCPARIAAVVHIAVARADNAIRCHNFPSNTGLHPVSAQYFTALLLHH